MWELALVVATAVHLGFQLTVSLIVYPALVAAPASTWAAVHTAHSRRIAPLVVVIYAALLVTAAAALLQSLSPGAIVATLAIALTIGLTAVAAGPLHVRLGDNREESLLWRLIWVDRLRTVLACVALVAATSA